MYKFVIDDDNTITDLLIKLEKDLKEKYNTNICLYFNENYVDIFFGDSEIYLGNIDEINSYIKYNEDEEQTEYINYDEIKEDIIKTMKWTCEDRISEAKEIIEILESGVDNE